MFPGSRVGHKSRPPGMNSPMLLEQISRSGYHRLTIVHWRARNTKQSRARGALDAWRLLPSRASSPAHGKRHALGDELCSLCCSLSSGPTAGSTASGPSAVRGRLGRTLQVGRAIQNIVRAVPISIAAQVGDLRGLF